MSQFSLINFHFNIPIPFEGIETFSCCEGKVMPLLLNRGLSEDLAGCAPAHTLGLSLQRWIYENEIVLNSYKEVSLVVFLMKNSFSI